MRVGIQAGNLRSGGAITHLTGLLEAAEPEASEIRKVVVWGSAECLGHLPRRKWLESRYVRELDRGLCLRALWEMTQLSRQPEQHCDVLFVPGGVYLGNYRPFVAMSRNLLPFQSQELKPYLGSGLAAKYWMLAKAHVRTLRQAAGIIFLSDYPKDLILNKAAPVRGATRKIPHGVAERFRKPPRKPRGLDSCTPEKPFVLLYVSSQQRYKHHARVVEAVSHLRQEHGWPLKLVLAGKRADRTSAKDLDSALSRFDSDGEFVHSLGNHPFCNLHEVYHRADAFIFASTCENLSNILIEAMAAGLPIACSSSQPMPDILGSAGRYFDPRVPGELEATLEAMLLEPEQRAAMGAIAFQRAGLYCWRRTARETLDFLYQVATAERGR